MQVRAESDGRDPGSRATLPRVALLFTKLNARVFRTTFASFDAGEPVPRPLADAFQEVDRQIDAIIDCAKLEKVA